MSVGIRQAAARRHGWSPLDLPSLTVWLDGSDSATVTMSGSNVATWADKSGTGRDVTAVAGGPTRTVTQNGLLTLSFAGGAGMSRASAGLHATGGCIAVVMRTATSGLPTYLSAPATITTTNLPAPADQWQTTTDNALYAGLPEMMSASWHDLRGQTSWGTVVTNRSLAGGTASASQWLDGTHLRSGSVPSSNWTTGGTLTVGRRDDGATWFAGDLAEVVMTDVPLGSTDRASLEAYLRDKWGTP